MRIWTVARRELKALFDLPTGYVLLVVFLAINGFLFSVRPISLKWPAQAHAGCAPLRFLFFVPAVTMRSLAEDIRGGQLEVVCPDPERAGAAAGQIRRLGVVPLDCSCPHRMHSAGALTGCGHALGHCYRPVCWAGLLAAGFAAIGTWASSSSRSQITAFMLALV